MNRRLFNNSVLAAMGLGFLAGKTASAATFSGQQQAFEAGHQMATRDGLKMTLSQHELPLSNKDRKQFVLTFDVHNANEPLQEKIYQLTDHNGNTHDIFMSPVDQNKLQAVYNWRTHA
jgi:hypothetical protein